jgi:hypothetical protein
MSLRLSLFAIVPLCLSSYALGAEPTAPPSEITLTAVSGHTGRVVVAGTGRTDRGLFAIEIGARRGKQCLIAAASQPVVAGSAKPGLHRASLCPGKRRRRRRPKGKRVSFANPHTFVRGVSICTTASEDTSKRRFRGIKIYGARIDSRGRARAHDTGESYRLAGCAMWHKAAYCPVGQIAVGVRAHGRGGEISGLALECREPAAP